MNALLDTHALLWWAAGQELAREAVEVIADSDNLVHVSAASIWEISIKQSLGKLQVDGDLDAVAREDFEPLDVNFSHARLAGELPILHRDPFDRLLIAQAKVEDLVVLTRDRRFAEYEVAVMEV